MTESAVQEVVAATPAKTPKKKALAKKTNVAAKKAPAAHPPTAQMVNNGIKNLKERGGSSLQAIKKYIASTYKVDAEKLSPFIKKYLKTAADGGKLIRTKGKGATGSFKLPSKDAKKGEKKVAKPKTEKKPKSTTPKKPKTAKSTTTTAAAPKKVKAAVTKSKTSKPKSAASKKSMSKVKKATKSPVAKKPKTPKPKKAAPKKVAAAAKK